MCKEPIDIERQTQIIGWLWWNQSKSYFVIRLCMTLCVLGVLIFSFLWYAVPSLGIITVYDSNCCAQFYILYLTHWALIMEFVYFVIITYLHGQVFYNKSFNLNSSCNK